VKDDDGMPELCAIEEEEEEDLDEDAEGMEDEDDVDDDVDEETMSESERAEVIADTAVVRQAVSKVCY
jgi:hypothetical protein